MARVLRPCTISLSAVTESNPNAGLILSGNTLYGTATGGGSSGGGTVFSLGPNCNLGVSYNTMIAASGGVPPYAYAMTSGSLPSGLSLGTNGSLTGIPLAVGTSTFTVTATETNGCTGSTDYTVAVLPSGSLLDTTKPTISITSPANKGAFSSPLIQILGSAHDSLGTVKSGVVLVRYSLNGGSQQLAGTINKFTNWMESVTLQPGWNSFVAQALDFRGNGSLLASNIYFYGATANAVGKYNGLFYETNGSGAPVITELSAGAVLNVNVTISRTYSGRIYLAGTNYALAGSFDLAGNSAATVSRAHSGKPDLAVNLHVDWTGATKQMTGTVSCLAEGWSSSLLADLAVYSRANPYPSPARYTMAIPPATNAPTDSPGGYGYGLVTNTPAGMISLTGALADSTPLLQSVPIAQGGRWPLYVNLYKGQGLLEGWLDFSSGVPAGEVTWIKPANPAGVKLTTYLGGFTNMVTVFGSVYAPVAPAITPAHGLLEITDGSGLSLPLTINAEVNNNNTIVSLPGATNTLTGSIAAPTGLLKVSFHRVGKATKNAVGVVLQSSNAAYGAFIGNNDGTGKTNTGAIYLH